MEWLPRLCRTSPNGLNMQQKGSINMAQSFTHVSDPEKGKWKLINYRDNEQKPLNSFISSVVIEPRAWSYELEWLARLGRTSPIGLNMQQKGSINMPPSFTHMSDPEKGKSKLINDRDNEQSRCDICGVKPTEQFYKFRCYRSTSLEL